MVNTLPNIVHYQATVDSIALPLRILFDRESEQVRLGGGIDVCIELDDLFRLMPLLPLPLPGPELPDVAGLTLVSDIVCRRC